MASPAQTPSQEKLHHILAALTAPQELLFSTPTAARRYRLSLYHFRRVAALQDPRALRVKISLFPPATVQLSYTPEDFPCEA